MLKRRSVQIFLGIIIIILLGVGGYYFVASKNTQSSQDQTLDDNTVQTLSPQSIGLKLEASSDNKKVRFTITKATDIRDIEYELTYEADSTAQEKSEGSDARVQRGITGQANIDQSAGMYQSSWLILGSQSANVVRYDTGVNSVNITLKITKNNGKVYQVQDKLDL